MKKHPKNEIIQFLYTNHRGETAVRRVIPIEVIFTSTKWHPKKQWLLRAYDLDRQAERRFALQKIQSLSTQIIDTVRIGVGVIVIKQYQQILLGKRLTSYNHGLWSVPAGHMKRGETFVAAAKRELTEETGLIATKVKLIGLNNYQDKRGERQYVNIDFVTEEWIGEVDNREPNLCERLEWFALDSLPDLLSIPTKIAIKSLITKKLCVTENNLDFLTLSIYDNLEFP
jgi:8-oxo-dGTP diphosphatase